MNRAALKQLAMAAIRVALGGAFAWAALTKVPNMELFAEETANYQLLPAALVPLFTVALAGLEIATGVLLVLGVAWRAANALIAAMLVAFIIALAQALARGIDLRCGCFGGAELASWWTVARDVVMLAGSVLLFRFGAGRVRFWTEDAAPRAG